MPHFVQNALAVVVGLILGSAVNMALIALSSSLIPPPPGVEMTNAESLAKAMHLLQPQHFVMPFLAHALGTLAGALAAYLIAASYKMQLAYVIGVFFFCGGMVASFMIPAPFWFIALDLLIAYVPMAWLATRIGSSIQQGKAITEE